MDPTMRGYMTPTRSPLGFFEFEGVPNQVANKTIRIQNHTKVLQCYEITRDPATNILNPVFQVYPWKSSVESGGSFTFQLQYCPKVPSTVQFDYFNVIDSKGICLKFGAKGKCTGPLVTTSANKLMFVCKSTQKRVYKMIELKNEASACAQFQFDINLNQSAFTLDTVFGSISPHRYIYVTITFVPPEPGTYTTELFCLINFQRPVVIKLEGVCLPEESTQHLKALDYIRFQQHQHISNTLNCYFGDVIYQPENQPPLTLSANCVDFGQTDVGVDNIPETFTVTNNTKTEITVQWGKDQDDIFSIVPHTSVMPSGAVEVFEAHFCPRKVDLLFSIELHGCGYRNNNLKDTDNKHKNKIFMPTSNILRMMGHTFAKDSYGWVPQYEVYPQKVILPACVPPIPVYSTFLIKRFGYLPIMFKFIPPQRTHYSVKPMQGIITDMYQVIVVQMHPEENVEKAYNEQWKIRFNGSSRNETTVDFQAYAEFPIVKTVTEFENQVQFPGTLLGCEGTVIVPLRNISGHCIRYKFTSPESSITIHNMNGSDNVIASNEVKYQNWFFTPQKVGLQEIEVNLETVALQDSCYPVGTTVHSTVKVFVYCESIGLIGFPKILEFGAIPLEVTKSSTFHVFNYSNCPTYFALKCIQRNFIIEQCETDIVIEKRWDTIPARSHMEITVHVSPSQLGLQEFAVMYQVRQRHNSINLNQTLQDDIESDLIHINYEGILPLMKVVELKFDVIETMFSKVAIWQYININGLNTTLTTTLPNTEAIVHINFPEAPVGARPLIVYLYLKSNELPTIWKIRRRRNCSCELVSKICGISKSYKYYQCPHRELFTILPTQDTLKPGDVQKLTLVIKYTLEGSWNLLYAIELSNNRTIVLNAHLIILPNSIPHLSTFTPSLDLQSVYLGDLEPAAQSFWLYNSGYEDAEYIVNTEPLDSMAEENYGVQILECLNPIDTIKAKSVHPIMFKFNPIELRSYETTLQLQLGIRTVDLMIRGEGVVNFNDHIRQLLHKAPAASPVKTPEMPVVFSIDHIIINQPFPTHNKAEQIFFIENQTDESYGYTWHEYKLDNVLEVSVRPSKGVLYAHETHTCQISVNSLNLPVLITARIEFESISLTAQRNRERSMTVYKSTEQEYEMKLKGEFLITKQGYTTPRSSNPVKLLPMPLPHYMVLAVTCCISNPIGMDVKYSFREQLKEKASQELDLSVVQPPKHMPPHVTNLVTTTLEKITWDIMSSQWFESAIKKLDGTPNPFYCQLTMNKNARNKLISQSYSVPSRQLTETFLSDVIYDVVHDIFQLEMFGA